MDDLYVSNMIVRYTDIDRSGCLGILEIPMIVQDTLTEYFGNLGSDNRILREQDQAGWVITKTRIQFGTLPFWQTKLQIQAYCVRRDAVRVVVEVRAADEEGNTAFTGVVENCAIDLQTRKIRRVSSVSYPLDAMIRESSVGATFEKHPPVFAETDWVAETQVHWFDIDFTRHTNNTRYINYMLYTLDADFLNRIRFTGMEFHYVQESREGEHLAISRNAGDGVLNFLIRRGDDDILWARMNYEDVSA